MDQAQLLDRCLAALDLPSDYALAKQWGLTTACISQYRTGKNRIDDYALCRIAETLDLDPRQLMAERELSRKPHGPRRSYWEILRKKPCGAWRLGAFIAPYIVTSLTAMMLPTTADAKATNAPGECQRLDIMSTVGAWLCRVLRTLTPVWQE